MEKFLAALILMIIMTTTVGYVNPQIDATSLIRWLIAILVSIVGSIASLGTKETQRK